VKAGTICQVLMSSQRDNTGVLRAMSQAYAGGFASHGRAVVFADMDQPQFAQRLAEIVRRPDVEAICSVGSWGVGTLLEEGGGAKRNLIEASGKRFIGHHGDYPFCPWVTRLLKHDFPQRVTLFNDPHAVDFTRRMLPPRGAYDHAPQAYCDVGLDPAGAAVPASRRPIRLLYVGKHLRTWHGRDLIVRGQPAYAAAYDTICERGLHEYQRSFITLCAEAHAAHKLPFEPARGKTQALLYFAYEAILSRRRAALLERLPRHATHLVLGGDGALPPQHPDSVVRRAAPFTEVLRMFEQARAVVVVQPNYSHAITERTLTAMHRGAVVLATPNAFLDEHFVDGEDYVRLDGTWADLDEKIAGLDDARRTDAIGEAARRKVTGRFSPRATVARYLGFLEPGRAAAAR
jgi:glycosyltransferase involved in cell wall biosynthesis